MICWGQSSLIEKRGMGYAKIPASRRLCSGDRDRGALHFSSPTSRALFIGRCTMGPVGVPVKVNSVSEFHANFGTGVVGTTLERAVELFFGNDGKELIVVRVFSPDPQSSAPPKAVMDLGAFPWRRPARAYGGEELWFP